VVKLSLTLILYKAWTFAATKQTFPTAAILVKFYEFHTNVFNSTTLNLLTLSLVTTAFINDIIGTRGDVRRTAGLAAPYGEPSWIRSMSFPGKLMKDISSCEHFSNFSTFWPFQSEVRFRHYSHRRLKYRKKCVSTPFSNHTMCNSVPWNAIFCQPMIFMHSNQRNSNHLCYASVSCIMKYSSNIIS